MPKAEARLRRRTTKDLNITPIIYGIIQGVQPARREGGQVYQNNQFNVLSMVRTANPALMKPMNLSSELEAVVGKGPLPRGTVVKKMWEYIKKHDLQNPANKRNIFADDKLMPIFGKKEVTMFEMTKLASGHMK